MTNKEIYPGYQFTTDNFDDERIDALKEYAKQLNEEEKFLEKENGAEITSYLNWHGDKISYKTRTRYYVWCRGRGSRTDPAKIKAKQIAFKQDYGRELSARGAKMMLTQDLPLWMAERAAVYLMKRYIHKDVFPEEAEIGTFFISDL